MKNLSHIHPIGPTLFVTNEAVRRTVVQTSAVSYIPLTDYSLYGILLDMAWEVEVTDEFTTWWNDLTEPEQEEISAKVDLLEERGPTLPRPHVDRVHQSRHQNRKELRGDLGGKSNKEYLRVLFAFDPRRTALLLLGGDKTDDPGWYDRFVPIADAMFDGHLKKLEEEQKKKEHQEKQNDRHTKKHRKNKK
jgi:hypothetical protein